MVLPRIKPESTLHNTKEMNKLIKINSYILLILCLGIGLLLVPSCSDEPSSATSTSVDNVIFPKQEWLKSSPEEQGMDSDLVAKALNFLENNSRHNGNKEVVIIRNGYMVHGGAQIDSTHGIWSCSKTFTSTVLGLLVDDGQLVLDQLAAPFEPILQEKYGEVTFRHFATMTSGYSAVGDSRWPDTQYADWSWTIYDPDEPLFAPGRAYAYWDEAQIMFGRVLTQVIQRPMYDLLRERITDPIGMGEWFWDTEKSLDSIPINLGCGGVSLNAKQLARWGWLFLNEGRWEDQQLISKEWVKMATSVQVPATLPVADTDRKNLVGSGVYGFNWWVNGKQVDGTLKWPGAPEGCYFASGFNNNKCIVIPQWDMVIVRMGEDGHPDDPDLVYSNFIKLLGRSIKT